MTESEEKEQRDGPATAAPEDQVASEGDASIEGCPVKMSDDKRCGRRIHYAPDHDPGPVCLMHSRDPEKSDAEFQEEFEAILEAAGDGVADFTESVFSSSSYAGRGFAAVCVFHQAKFTQWANFSGATFTQGADFTFAEFRQGCHFVGANFAQDAMFNSAIFQRDAYFTEAEFKQGAEFTQTSFVQRAYFNAAKFLRKASFTEATFTQEVQFANATFAQVASFGLATFARRSDFLGAKFKGEADFVAKFLGEADFRSGTFEQVVDFSPAVFTGDADFTGARFKSIAAFGGATFAQVATFSSAKFTKEIRFEGAKFLGGVEFRKTRFRHDRKHTPGPVFSRAEFAQPEKVIFYKNYLGQTLFHNCDVSRVNFSLVVWRRRKGSRKRMLFEEVVDLKAAEDMKPSKGSIDDRRYSLIAELYQQLKKNFDERKDYWTAGDFHYGEMEMKRLATKPAGRIFRLVIGGILGEARMNLAPSCQPGCTVQIREPVRRKLRAVCPVARRYAAIFRPVVSGGRLAL